jgi:hypothetical protein
VKPIKDKEDPNYQDEVPAGDTADAVDAAAFNDDEDTETVQGRYGTRTSAQDGGMLTKRQVGKGMKDVDVRLPSGTVTVIIRNGQIVRVDGGNVNISALNMKFQAGHKLKDALLTSSNVRRPQRPVMESVLDYMPESDGEYEEPVVLETTRDRLTPKTSHQMDEYRRLLGG